MVWFLYRNLFTTKISFNNCFCKQSAEINNNFALMENTIKIQGEISGYDYSLSSVQSALSDVSGDALNIQVHSPGGEVFEGLAIYAAIKNDPRKITVTNIGLAASISSVIALSGEKTYMYPTSYLMVHNPYGGAFGEVKDMRKTADLMEKMGTTIAHVYAEKMVSTKGYEYPEALALALQWMAAETWFTAEEALEAGLIDGIMEGESVYSIEDFTPLAQYSNTPNYIYNSILAKNKNMSKSIIEKIKNLLSGSDEEPEVVETVEAVAETPEAEPEVLEAVAETPETEPNTELLEVMQAMAAEITALKAQVKNTAGAPSGGFAGAQKKNITGNDKAFAPLVAMLKQR